MWRRAGLKLHFGRDDRRGGTQAAGIEANGLSRQRAAVILNHLGTILISKRQGKSSGVLREREASLRCNDPINIQYTSGTTGRPKGATLSHHNILNNGFFIGEQLQYTPDDRICLPVPFYHCFGCVLGSLAVLTHGSAVVLP